MKLIEWEVKKMSNQQLIAAYHLNVKLANSFTSEIDIDWYWCVVAEVTDRQKVHLIPHDFY